MKKLLASLILISSTLPVVAKACDDILLKSSAGLFGTKSFAQDCDFQNRYAQVKSIFSKYGKNVEDVTEYKALRFISQQDYLRNLQGKQLAPQKIYDPAPQTWEIWESGIDQAMKMYGAKNSLLQRNYIQADTISYMNKILMERGNVSLKDKEISSQASLGVFRSYTDNSSGYCMGEDSTEQNRALRNVRSSIAQFQSNFENRVGQSFVSLVKSKNGKWPEKASMDTGVNARDYACGRQLTHSFMYYTPGYMVENQIDWVRIFVDEVLKSYKKGQPMLAPTELAAIVQKWIVSIHPFVDGNGRTSRGIQDIITRSFSVPFTPAGTLQNDALETLETYIQKTYYETDKMLKFLESCAQNLQTGRALDYRCKSTSDHR